ncbi:MAG: hypothetical protein KAI81_07560, partial [Candidatus Marinimicrobia bacterium]|nr:hypothetical protein [Candidatus Neomarinimicrobiota bacterium]
MSRALFGEEDGLLGYWKFDEGTSDVSFDMTSVKESATLEGASWSSSNFAQIKLSAFTDDKGNYEIRGIWYDATTDAGTDYTVTPIKDKHNTFTPADETVNLNRNDPEMNDVKFLDESMYTLSGRINFLGEDGCPVIGAEILLDSLSLRPRMFTDAEGEYKIDFEPEASGIVTVVYGGEWDTTATDTSYIDGHLMYLGGVEQGYTVTSASEDIAAVNFVNKHTESFGGEIGGGECLYDIGLVEVKLTSTPSCFERIDTVFSGEYFLIEGLPPVDFQVVLGHADPDIDAYFKENNRTMSLKESSDTTVVYMYRAPLQVAFTDLPGTRTCSGASIIPQLEPDSVAIQVYEQYDGGDCYLHSITVKVNDDLSEQYYDGEADLDENGKVWVYFTPREPNVQSGGDYPYQKKLEVTVTDALDRNAGATFWAYVEGEKKQENNQFTTSTSRIPWFILRNPPGDGSYTYLSNEESISTNFSMNMTDSDGNSTEETLHLGFDKTIVTGIGMAIETAWSLTFDAGHGWEGTKTDVDIDETSFTFTRSETYSTSGDEYVTGDDATVFVGSGLTMTFGLATNLSVDDTCGIQLDTSLVAGLDGFNSTYMFSKYYIRKSLMPSLAMKYRLNGEEQDSIDFHYWKSILDKDSIAVANAIPDGNFQFGTDEQSSNISFDAGVSYEYTITTDSSFTSGTQV